MPRMKQMKQQKPTWNLGKPDGWNRYEILTDEKANEIVEIVEDADNNIETVTTKINKLDNKIKFKSFGKTKLKTRRSAMNKQKDKTQHEKDVALKEKETERVEKTN